MTSGCQVPTTFSLLQVIVVSSTIVGLVHGKEAKVIYLIGLVKPVPKMVSKEPSLDREKLVICADGSM
jgi:hypothetical protein